MQTHNVDMLTIGLVCGIELPGNLICSSVSRLRLSSIATRPYSRMIVVGYIQKSLVLAAIRIADSIFPLNIAGRRWHRDLHCEM
jgi:hypothetical protein